MANKKAKKKSARKKEIEKAEIAIHCKYDKLVNPSELKPHPANPARHPEAQMNLLAKIMTSHGIRWPISVSKQSGYIVSGHCRQLAAMFLSLKQYPVVYQDFKDNAEELAVLVADNQIQELAEIDGSKMGDIIVELDQVNYPLELTALSEIQIQEYVEGPTSISGQSSKDQLENYMSFVVTEEQRKEIEQCLDEQEGDNRTEQLLTLCRSSQK